MNKLFTVQDLHIQYKDKCLLSVPNLTLSSGKLIALIGANGAGKSTLLHTLLGKKHPFYQSGQVMCYGQSVADWVRRGRIAWVGQHERFELPLVALDYALLGVNNRLMWYESPKHADSERAMAKLAEFDLSHLSDKRIQSLSGGEKQRLAIVRVLMQETDILLFDEPTNHLDIKYERKLFEFLRRLINDGKSIVVVLHSLSHAHRYADEIIAMHQGQILAQGAPNAVMTTENLSIMYGTTINCHDTADGRVFI
ncbi:ABC transporter [Moraxella bovoculi]|uniref:ABC transporter n=1 Tax=Moraxella bovoculi TaxID=386891 RepID=A0AAC8T9Y2_9GAMM|nr:ABC transporter ATP-binding protein [Moraxella bovoculi]AKG07956.1 ABC transporter [Moraxella bovoculi]AKG09508.1 ABC transporter [Moraxella bovoculi]AKG11323.1 ABC transporter [Moraxella bovoculi]AKG13331.1 ABC transporter [Moraxella bovoculi]